MTWKENDTLGVAGLARRWCVCTVIPQERVGTEKLFGSLSELVRFVTEPVILSPLPSIETLAVVRLDSWPPGVIDMPSSAQRLCKHCTT